MTSWNLNHFPAVAIRVPASIEALAVSAYGKPNFFQRSYETRQRLPVNRVVMKQGPLLLVEALRIVQAFAKQLAGQSYPAQIV